MAVGNGPLGLTSKHRRGTMILVSDQVRALKEQVESNGRKHVEALEGPSGQARAA